MPFYTRIRARAPWWQPIALGAGIMLCWTLLGGIFGPGSHGNLPTAILYATLFTVLGGAIAGACHWALGTSLVHRYVAARWAIGTVSAAAFLTTITAATTQPDITLRARMTTGFLLSTLVISVVFGWVVGMDLFSKAGTSERIYLNPAEYARLPAAEQARLRLDGAAEKDRAGTVEPPDRPKPQ